VVIVSYKQLVWPAHNHTPLQKKTAWHTTATKHVLSEEHMKVLLVDDHRGMRDFFKEQIISLGHEVVEAVDGLDAITKLFGDANTADESIGAVITDLQMPQMNGEQLVDYLNKRGATTPCLLHTAGIVGEKHEYPFVTINLKTDPDHVENFLKAVA
jgi:two-component system, chemotaxis family, chemotaxis protein CheY